MQIQQITNPHTAQSGMEFPKLDRYFDTWLLIVFQSEHLTSETSLSLCQLQAKAPSWTGTVPPQGVASSGKAHNMNEKSWNYNWCKMLSSLCLQIAVGPSPTFPIPGFHRMNGLATQHLTQNSRMQRSEALTSFLMLSAWVQKASTWYKVFLQNACCVNFFTYHTIPYHTISYHTTPLHYTTFSPTSRFWKTDFTGAVSFVPLVPKLPIWNLSPQIGSQGSGCFVVLGSNTAFRHWTTWVNL